LAPASTNALVSAAVKVDVFVEFKEEATLSPEMPAAKGLFDGIAIV